MAGTLPTNPVMTAGLALWRKMSRQALERTAPPEALSRPYLEYICGRLGAPGLDARTEEHRLESGGASLKLYILAASPGAPTVVFIPGTGFYALFFAKFLDELNKRGFNVVSYDPRGSGRSGGARGDYTIGEQVNDAMNVLTYALERLGGPAVVAGSNLGGVVAFYTAAKDGRVKGAVCHNLADLNGTDNLALARWPPPRVLTPALKRFLEAAGKNVVPLPL